MIERKGIRAWPRWARLVLLCIAFVPVSLLHCFEAVVGAIAECGDAFIDEWKNALMHLIEPRWLRRAALVTFAIPLGLTCLMTGAFYGAVAMTIASAKRAAYEWTRP